MSMKNKTTVCDDERIREDNRKCRVCGCTWFNACPGGCYWVEEDLCSNCADPEIYEDESS